MLPKIKKCFGNDRVLYTSHARKEMYEEEFGQIKEQEVFEAVLNGEVIEDYFDDKPYPSVLIYGNSNREKPLHIVCAYSNEDDTAIVVTVYQPDPCLWDEYRRRKQ